MTTTTVQMTAEPGSHELDIVRDFDAPRELLLRAHTEPELLARWLGPRRLKMDVEVLEARDGGRWRFLHSGEDGTVHGFHGVFHGDPTVEGIVQTWEYEGMPGKVALQDVRFEDLGGRTRMRMRSVYQSPDDRDAHIGSGMEGGMTESMERLDELLEALPGS